MQTLTIQQTQSILKINQQQVLLLIQDGLIDAIHHPDGLSITVASINRYLDCKEYAIDKRLQTLANRIALRIPYKANKVDWHAI